MDEAHPKRGCLIGRVDVSVTAIDEDRAAIGLHQPGEDLNEGRLARPICANQSVDLARRNPQRYAFQRGNPAIGFCDGIGVKKRARKLRPRLMFQI